MKKVVFAVTAVIASCLFLSACLGKPEVSKLQGYARSVRDAVSVHTETVISNGGYTLNVRRIDYIIGAENVTVTEEVTALSESLEEGESHNTTAENYTIRNDELFSLFPLNIDCKIDTRYFENGGYNFNSGVLSYNVAPDLEEEFLNGSAQADKVTVKVAFKSTYVKSFIIDYVLPSGNSVKTKFSYEYKSS